MYATANFTDLFYAFVHLFLFPLVAFGVLRVPKLPETLYIYFSAQILVDLLNLDEVSSTSILALDFIFAYTRLLLRPT